MLLCLLLRPFLSGSSIGRRGDVAAAVGHRRNLAVSSSKAAFLWNTDLNRDQPQVCLFMYQLHSAK